MLIVGSVALTRYISGIRPRDVDILLPADSPHAEGVFTTNLGDRVVPLEITKATPGSTDDILTSLYSGLAPIEVLYWLKMSHRFKKDSPHFTKTRNDIILMRGRFPYVMGMKPSWFEQREKETYTKTPALNVSKEEFFDTSKTGVIQHYDHDWLHTVVARIVNGTKIPTYTRYMKDGAAVACDRGKFEALGKRQRLDGVIEEAMVLALERSLIPTWINSSIEVGEHQYNAYRYALQKVCTSITGGWFREFAWENYIDALILCPDNFWEEALELIKKEGFRNV
jgi:hypothetical protein